MGGLPEGHRARSLSLRAPRPQTLPRGAALPQVSPPPQTTRTGPDTCHQTPALSVTYTLLLFRFTHTLVPTPRTWHVCTTHLTQTHRNLAPGVDPRHIYTVHAPHRVIS